MMLPPIWFRRIHRSLAAWLSIGLLATLLSGIVMAWDATRCQVQSYALTSSMEDIHISDFITSLKPHFVFVDKIEINRCGQLLITGEHKNNSFGTWDWNPDTSEAKDADQKRGRLVQWMTILHRSFFLGTIGRVWAAISAFLLLAFLFSGLLLWWNTYGPKISRTGVFHVDFGLAVFLPLSLLAGTGLAMSADHFGFLNPEEEKVEVFPLNETVTRNCEAFDAFQSLLLSDLAALEYPFVVDEGEWFRIQFRDGSAVKLDALTGAKIESTEYAWGAKSLRWMDDVHTGERNIVWALLWLVSSLVTCAVSVTGVMIWRRNKIARVSRVLLELRDPDVCLVVGSQGGTTWNFANAFADGLMAQGCKVEIQDFERFHPKASIRNVVFMVSTYGRGRAPDHLCDWRNTVENWPAFSNELKLAVVGFGDRKYPEFAEFGRSLMTALFENRVKPGEIPFYTVNAQNWEEFQTRVHMVCKSMRLPEVQMQVVDEPVEPSSEFELQLTARHVLGSLAWLIFEPLEVNGYKPTSGDLLSVTPPGSKSERLYSLAVLNNGTWGVSVRLIPDGICSGWLHSISLGSKIQVDVKPNPEFHLPMWQDQPMLLIANGSGIGPLLGMIEKLPDDQNAVLIWGLQTEDQASFARGIIDEAIERRALSRWYLACSRPLNGPKRYVQDIITNDLDAGATWANSRSRLIICGSHEMEEGVEAALFSIDAAAVSSIKLEGRWQADCY